MNIKTKVAARIRELRKAKKLSQEQLAWQSDVDRSFVGRIESGRINVTIETLDKLMAVLGVSYPEFFNNQIFN